MAVEFREELPEAERRRIIQDSIFRAGEKGRLSPASLLTEINKLEGEYLGRPERRFTLMTTMSMRYTAEMSRKSVAGCVISFDPSIPPRFDRGSIVGKATAIIGAESPKNYTVVRVSTSGRSGSEAADRALDALDLLRALWNYSRNRSYTKRTLIGRPSPVNRIILGPLHTLHKPTGKLIPDTFWYDPEFAGPEEPFEVSRWSAFQEEERLLRRRLRGHSYRRVLEESLLGYTHALDGRNLNTAFIHL